MFLQLALTVEPPISWLLPLDSVSDLESCNTKGFHSASKYEKGEGSLT